MAMPQLQGAAEVVRISVGSGSNKVKFARALEAVLRTEFFISNYSNIKPNQYLWQSG